MADQWDRWNHALSGNKLDMGAKGDPPSGYFRRNAGIYRESAPALPVSPVRFFDNKADAMADMERFAKLEA